MLKLSDKAKEALRGAYATRGKHKGQLLARAPQSQTLAYAAWQGAMLSVNPFLASIAGIMFMSAEQKEIWKEVSEFFDALPRSERINAQRDRKALEAWGVW
jgi:hypothetical protein